MAESEVVVSNAARVGWVWRDNMRQPHYIGDDGRSLCGKWGVFSREDLQDTPHPSASPCKACYTKRDKQIDRERKTATR